MGLTPRTQRPCSAGGVVRAATKQTKNSTLNHHYHLAHFTHRCPVAPDPQIDWDKLLRYMQARMSGLIDSDYTIVYLHHGISKGVRPRGCDRWQAAAPRRAARLFGPSGGRADADTDPTRPQACAHVPPPLPCVFVAGRATFADAHACARAHARIRARTHAHTHTHHAHGWPGF